MNKPALTEAVKTDLPSPKPNRGKRLALRFAVLVAAVSALGAAYWFTRPPELVWWRSPDLHGSHHRLMVLIPNGWRLDDSTNIEGDFQGFWEALYGFTPVDSRSGWLQRFRPKSEVR